MSEVALVARAAAYTGLTNLTGLRIYPSHLPANTTLPAVVYTRISGQDSQSMGVADGLPRARYQLTAIASQYSQARDVVAQLKAAFQRTPGTYGGVVVQHSEIENEADAGYDEDLKTFSRIVDVLIVSVGT